MRSVCSVADLVLLHSATMLGATRELCKTGYLDMSMLLQRTQLCRSTAAGLQIVTLMLTPTSSENSTEMGAMYSLAWVKIAAGNSCAYMRKVWCQPGNDTRVDLACSNHFSQTICIPATSVSRRFKLQWAPLAAFKLNVRPEVWSC